MRVPYESWVSNRLNDAVRCSIEQSLICIPLRNDPICRACYQTDQSAPDASAALNPIVQDIGTRASKGSARISKKPGPKRASKRASKRISAKRPSR